MEVLTMILAGFVARGFLIAVSEKLLGVKLIKIPPLLGVVAIAHYVVFAPAYAGFSFVNMFTVFGLFLPEVIRSLNLIFKDKETSNVRNNSHNSLSSDRSVFRGTSRTS